jgi:hypothetical protein
MSADKKKGLKKILGSAGGGLFALVMAAIFLTPIIPMTIGKGTGYYPALMDMLAKCPEATSALGTNPRAGLIGLNTGSCSSSGGSSWSASGRMPVKGSKGSGTLRYSISKSGGTVTLHGASLSAGGKDINVGACLIKAGYGKGGKGQAAPQDPPMLKERL